MMVVVLLLCSGRALERPLDGNGGVQLALAPDELTGFELEADWGFSEHAGMRSLLAVCKQRSFWESDDCVGAGDCRPAVG